MKMTKSFKKFINTKYIGIMTLLTCILWVELYKAMFATVFYPLISRGMAVLSIGVLVFVLWALFRKGQQAVEDERCSRK
jgi:K+ transporter